MGRGKTKIKQAALTVSLLALGVEGVVAQELDAAVSATLSFSSNLVVDTNPSLIAGYSGTVLEFTEDLGFSFLSATSTQTLQFNVSSGFSVTTTAGGGTSTSFEYPTFDFLYRRDSADANLRISANYWSGDVTTAFDIDPTDETFLIVDTGTLVRSSVDLAYDWRLNAPLGFSLNATIDTRDYEGTTDPALFDSTTSSLAGAANYRISPSTSGSLTATLTDYSSSDATSTNSVTKDLELTVTNELAGGLVLDGRVGYTTVDSTVSSVTTTENGIYFGLDVVQPVSLGSYFGGIQFDNSGGVNTSALTFGRSIDFPDGSLSASVTADQTAGSAAQLLGSLSYLKELPDGEISVDVSQTLTTNSVSEDIRFSTLGIDYQKDLTESSGMNLSLDFSRTEDAGTGTAETLNRATLSASYSTELTQDWDLNVGYSRRQSSGSTTATAVSDSIFMTLTRDLEFRF